MRRLISFAFLLSTLTAPSYAGTSTPLPPSAPHIRLSVILALITDPDLKAAQVNPRTIAINQINVSRQPWGEARFQHFDLQVIAGKDASRLLSALLKTQHLEAASVTDVPSGTDGVFLNSESLNSETASTVGFQPFGRSFSANHPVLRSSINADGTITLSFACDDLPPMTIKTPSGAVDQAQFMSTYTEVGTIHTGETIALTGAHLNRAEAIVFIAATWL